jgi:Tol biopolymer transport system component
VANLQASPADGRISFWWRTTTATGTDAYELSGKRVYRLPAVGQIDEQDSRAFWAPDGHSAVLKMGPPGNESLQLSWVDAPSPRILRAKLTGLSDPLWSPDSSKVAFTEAANNGPVTLQIIGADGREIWRFNKFQSFFRDLAWSRCD